jgi:hypothetical protein
MLNRPTPQRALRLVRPQRLAERAGRATTTTEHQAALAWRLTDRDRWILRLVHEHRVLTSHQITAMAFPSTRSGRQRLRELYLWSVLDRFQPYTPTGTAAQHYVLGPAGAAVLAAEHGLDLPRLGYRRDRANAIAHSLRLAHTVGVNDWFAALITHAGHTDQAGDGGWVSAWWSEARCARHFGDLARPDAYGRYTTHPHHGTGVQEVEFFLEYDTGTEALTRVAAKLSGYAALTAATAITTPLLIWLPTARREAAARRLLGPALAALDTPAAVPVATAAADLLDPTHPHASPADPIWLPLTRHSGDGRMPLGRLAEAWPWLPPTTTGLDPPTEAAHKRELPPPTPMPPIPPTSPRAARG